MSFISQMLRDLDKRNAASPVATVPPALRTGGSAAKPRVVRTRLLVWSSVIVVAVAVLWPDITALFGTTKHAEVPQFSVAPAPGGVPAELRADAPSQAPAQADGLSPSEEYSVRFEPADAETAEAETSEPGEPTSQPANRLPAPPEQSTVPTVSARVQPASPPVAVAPSPPPAGVRIAKPASGQGGAAPRAEAARPWRDQKHTDTERLYREALEHLHAGRLELATFGLEAVLLRDADHVGARQSLAAALVQRGNLEGAVEVLEAGLARDPSQGPWAMLSARLLAELGRNVQAVKTLERSLPNAAGAPDYHALLATLQQALGQHAAAAEHFTRALARRPDEGRWWVGIGISLRAQGVGGAADEAFANALASPGLPLALRAYAENELAERAR